MIHPLHKRGTRAMQCLQLRVIHRLPKMFPTLFCRFLSLKDSKLMDASQTQARNGPPLATLYNPIAVVVKLPSTAKALCGLVKTGTVELYFKFDSVGLE